MKTFYWDFYGPKAQRTAEHFLVHLDEFLVRNACAGSVTGLRSDDLGHVAVWCRTEAQHELAIERSLRPQRWEPFA
jgi:hypothetical protein